MKKTSRHPACPLRRPSTSRLILWAVLLAFFSPIARADEPMAPPGAELGVDFFGGARFLGSDWSPVDTHAAGGIEFRVRPKNWPVRFLTAVYVSGRKNGSFDGLELELTLTDVGAGIEIPFRTSPRTELWIGGVATWVEATAAFASSFSQSTEDSAAAFVNAGFTARVTDHFHVGVEGRWLTGTSMSLQAPFGGAVPTDVDHTQVGALFGWRW